MARTVALGIQDFRKLLENGYFYIDKTMFIKEWWESGDDVTLLTRPRRFGKTLAFSMLEQFFSVKYNDADLLFQHLDIWQEKAYQKLCGTYPVISLSFASVKETNFENARSKICQLIASEYARCTFLLKGDILSAPEKELFQRKAFDMNDVDATLSLNQLSEYLCRYYGKKVLILLDEYDTPMQEAYMHGYWDQLADFIRNLFNATFKTNPYLERAMLTGITRISKESLFSDLNNLAVVTTTSNRYAAAFGFTEQEVFAAMDELALTEKEEVRRWYDGFIFGSCRDIYNPWSILNYFREKKFAAYWANTSSDHLISRLMRESGPDTKMIMEDLLSGQTFCTQLDEQVVFSQLDHKASAVFSLLLASGYLRVNHTYFDRESGKTTYELGLTNMEVRLMFVQMIEEWFREYTPAYNQFIQALLLHDIDAMNEYMNQVSEELFSSFDTARKPSQKSQPERFYHGFVLGLIVELSDRYVITSNRESGFGRYDMMLTPKKETDHAYLIEFKVYQPKKEASLEDTVQTALAQIEEKHYDRELIKRGIPSAHIYKYGFAFEGKSVCIGSNR
ncbi:MAG: ATP-binding protein [Eubacterium sp.]|nr:ATP-binding protein [Eubacterium sp.]